MLPKKEREERGRSIRNRVLAYIKTGRLAELDKAQDELVILRDLEELAGARQGEVSAGGTGQGAEEVRRPHPA